MSAVLAALDVMVGAATDLAGSWRYQIPAHGFPF